MTANDFLNKMSIGHLNKENVSAVYDMCEKNTSYISQSLETFKRASLGSSLFNVEFTTVVTDKNGNVAAFFMVVFRKPFVFKKKRKVAVLKFFVIANEWRLKGLGTKIFDLLLQKIRVSENKCFKMKMEVMTSLPDYWCPGLDPRQTEAFFFLKKLGFKRKGERINLCVDSDTISSEEPPTELKGYLFSRATPDDMEELKPLKFMPKGYQLGFWPEETAMTFKNDPITSFIAKDKKIGSIIGWASHSIHFPGSFGPTGVKKSLQGKGIGSVLLNWCLWDIKQMGIKRTKILWVVGDTIYFYLKSKGAHICEIFWTMKRRV